MPYELDDLEFESVALSEEHGRDFDEWVATRLSEWPLADIRALDEWLLAEAHFEFIPAVRLVLEDSNVGLSSSSEPMTTSASWSASSAGGNARLGRAMILMPAAAAARSPLVESSTAAQSVGATPRRRAASR
jgi:hypothetical protein